MTATTLSLQRTTLGWALYEGPHRVVFEAIGPFARRRCLAYASRLGALRLRFDEQLRAA